MGNELALNPEYVRERLAAFRAADPAFDNFGAEKHRYTLGPVLTEEQVLDVERRLGVRLPEDYRTFLLTIGNGGAGPSYGLAPVEQLVWEGVQGTFVAPSTFDAYENDVCDEGILELCNHGCAHYTGLVITGQERGAMYMLFDNWVPESPAWNVLASVKSCQEYDQTFQSILEHQVTLPRLSFSTWYSQWLSTYDPAKALKVIREHLELQRDA